MNSDRASNTKRCFGSNHTFVEPILKLDPDRKLPNVRIEVKSNDSEAGKKFSEISQYERPTSPLKRLKQYTFGGVIYGNRCQNFKNTKKSHSLLAPRPNTQAPSQTEYNRANFCAGASSNAATFPQKHSETLTKKCSEELFKRKNCDECVKRKIKCDGNQPCGTCVRKRLNCAYSYKQKPGPKVKPSSPSIGSKAQCPTIPKLSLETTDIECGQDYFTKELVKQQGALTFDNPKQERRQKTALLGGASRLLPSFKAFSEEDSNCDAGSLVEFSPLTAPVTPSLAMNSSNYAIEDDNINMELTKALLLLKHGH
mmetsp:Transcript_19051/g.28103  ORF Transcript_19051/g.28103 Transcript_19051/m.28103 type:complete len:312 (+) Transcript_19051:115-1050(+)